MNTPDQTPCATVPGPRALTAHARARETTPSPGQACRLALDLLREPRLSGSDYYPFDDEILSAWTRIRPHCLGVDSFSQEHLEQFVATHLDLLRDLLLRAKCGRAPARFLDDLQDILECSLDAVVSSAG